MKLLYMPLDERPCNYKFPSMNLILNNNIELITIPNHMMGSKKKEANLELIYKWLEENLYKCDGAVISLEMLIYGGLLPSRIHHNSFSFLIKRLDRFKKLVQKVKKEKSIEIYLFALVMRTPAYSSSEEEPTYYKDYGKNIFQKGFLENKKQIVSLNKYEEQLLRETNALIPNSIIEDYENRRNINKDIVLHAADLLKENLIDYLVIPQDDSSQYGYGPRDKKLIFSYIEQINIKNKVLTYPGADEVGSALLCRSILNQFNTKPYIKVVFDIKENETTIPKYEGMELKNSIKYQIEVVGAKYTEDIEKCDIILFVHTKECQIQDSWHQNIYEYDDEIYKKVLSYNKPFIISDVAYANGSDLSFVKSLFDKKINDNMLSYAAWNTAGNTIGTAISSAISQYLYGNKNTRDKLFFYRIADDCVYQSIVRKKYNILLSDKCVESYIHIKDSDTELINKIKNDLEENLKSFYKTLPFAIDKISFPWQRLFEIDIKLGNK